MTAAKQEQRIEALEKDVMRLLSRATRADERLAKAEANGNQQERLVAALTSQVHVLEGALERSVAENEEVRRSHEARLAQFEAQLTAVACKADRYNEAEGARKEARLVHVERTAREAEDRLQAIELDTKNAKALINDLEAVGSRVHALEGAVGGEASTMEDLGEQMVELEEELERQDKVQEDGKQQMLEAFKELETRVAAKPPQTMRPPTTLPLPFTSMEGGLVQQWVFSFMCLHEQGPRGPGGEAEGTWASEAEPPPPPPPLNPTHPAPPRPAPPRPPRRPPHPIAPCTRPLTGGWPRSPSNHRARVPHSRACGPSLRYRLLRPDGPACRAANLGGAGPRVECGLPAQVRTQAGARHGELFQDQSAAT